jgi:putative membrane-bound dehydrogenase-like protein
MRRLVILLVVALLHGAAQAETLYDVGVARVDITPAYPIRLSGYAVRTKESEGIEQHLFAKAMAIGSDREGAALLVTVDNLAVPGYLIDELAERLKDTGVTRGRLVVNASHTHCGPCLTGAAINIFGKPMLPEQQATVDRYTRELLDDLEKVCLAALADRNASKLAWGLGEVGFSANRRTRGGPVEHVMPMLTVTGRDGKLRAIVVDYACHGTTLPGQFNKVCGDWIGYAQESIEQRHPGVVAMVTIGCSGDANPEPRGTLALAQQHGRAIATEVDRVLGSNRLTPLHEPLATQFKRIDIAFDPLSSREKFEELAKRRDAIGGNARIQLAILSSGKPVPTSLPYPIETWTFGDQLAMVFLAGEVVVDYDLRLKHDFDAVRLWVCGYSNDVPCYIPSKRILKEGGYEAEGAMTYYARPARLSPGTENDILREVMRQLPSSFRTSQSLDEYPLPKSPEESRRAWRTREDMTVELVASEPLIESPIAIDWGPDGKLWVLEMIDYPNGLHENMVPGGRVKVLESTHHDGHYDKATIFLDHLTRPTGLMVWGKGALICAAPDILYAEDSNGAGHADIVKKLFTGFGPQNEQWLLNGLAPGLDGWIYGASSISNGPIEVVGGNSTIDLGNRDFRMHPDTFEFEPAAGRTQYCRVRDDWGNWFGNDNSNLLWHYPIAEHYLRRNPYVTAPRTQVLVPAGYDVNQLYPASRILARFNNPGDAGRTTSACGPSIYRDELLGSEFEGNALICEPVHDMVMRLKLSRRGVTFSGKRAEDNAHSEFLASTDNWSRPVQTRTGPDGALWVVDMYRFVIEHPRWIPPERLATLDIRAGADMGRIYRVYPKDHAPRDVTDLISRSSADVAKLMDSPNGTFRDMVQVELTRRQDAASVPALVELARSARRGSARVQAMWTLAALNSLKPELVRLALSDADPDVRCNGLRLAEPFLQKSSDFGPRVAALADDPQLIVRYQAALTLGDWHDPRAAEALAKIALRDGKDAYVRAAVLSSATPYPVEILYRLLAGQPQTDLVGQLVATAGAVVDERGLGLLIATIAPKKDEPIAAWHFVALAGAMDAIDRRKIALGEIEKSSDESAREAAGQCRRILQAAGPAARDSKSTSVRIAAIGLLGRGGPIEDADLRMLGGLLDLQTPAALQQAALSALTRDQDVRVVQMLLADWPAASPGLRSTFLEMILARPRWVRTLLDAMEHQKVKAGDITASARARLLASPEDDIRSRAQALFSAAHPSSRQQVLEQFRPALSLKGDFNRGHAIFAKTCTACHQLQGEGNVVGADLTALTDRSPQALMIDILDPNAAVDGRFVDYVVELRDGRTLSGIIADESAGGMTVVQGNGIRDKVLRRDIIRLRSTGLSLMPDGLEAGMTPQDLADLMAYVAQASRDSHAN